MSGCLADNLDALNGAYGDIGGIVVTDSLGGPATLSASARTSAVAARASMDTPTWFPFGSSDLAKFLVSAVTRFRGPELAGAGIGTRADLPGAARPWQQAALVSFRGTDALPAARTRVTYVARQVSVQRRASSPSRLCRFQLASDGIVGVDSPN